MADDMRSLPLIGRVWTVRTKTDIDNAISFFSKWYVGVSQDLAREGHGMILTDGVMNDGTPYLMLLWTKDCPCSALVMVKHILVRSFYAKEYPDKEMEFEMVWSIIQELKLTLFVEQQAKLN